MYAESASVAEIIPYKNFKEKIRISKREVEKGRHVEVWEDYIYSAERWLRW